MKAIKSTIAACLLSLTANMTHAGVDLVIEGEQTSYVRNEPQAGLSAPDRAKPPAPLSNATSSDKDKQPIQSKKWLRPLGAVLNWAPIKLTVETAKEVTNFATRLTSKLTGNEPPAKPPVVSMALPNSTEEKPKINYPVVTPPLSLDFEHNVGNKGLYAATNIGIQFGKLQRNPSGNLSPEQKIGSANFEIERKDFEQDTDKAKAIPSASLVMGYAW